MRKTRGNHYRKDGARCQKCVQRIIIHKTLKIQKRLNIDFHSEYERECVTMAENKNENEMLHKMERKRCRTRSVWCIVCFWSDIIHQTFKIQILRKSDFHSGNKGEMCTVKNEKNMWRKMDDNRCRKESANHFECFWRVFIRWMLKSR